MTQAVAPLPPGPKAPAAWQLLRYSHSPLPFLEDCARRYGEPFTIRLPSYGKFVMLASPGAVRDVFRGDPHALHSGEGNEFLTVTVGKNSVLVLDDEPHARQRRVLLPPLKGERMRSFFDASGRMCLGMAFALYEMKVVLGTLFARVRLARPPGSRSAPVRRGVSLAPDDGALMTAAEG